MISLFLFACSGCEKSDADDSATSDDTDTDDTDTDPDSDGDDVAPSVQLDALPACLGWPDEIDITGVVSDDQTAAKDLLVTVSINGESSAMPYEVGGQGALTTSAWLDDRGSKELVVEVTDEAGNTGTDSVAFDVNAAPTAPGVSISHDTVDNEVHAVLDLPSTDPDGDPLTYSYTWTHNGNVGIATGPTADAASGYWELAVTVTDGVECGGKTAELLSFASLTIP